MKKDGVKLWVDDLGILLEEVFIPFMMKRDYWEEFKQFGTWESWNCFEDQCVMMANVVKLFELLNSCSDDVLEVLNGEME